MNVGCKVVHSIRIIVVIVVIVDEGIMKPRKVEGAIGGGFVEYGDPKHLLGAIRNLNCLELNGRTLKAKWIGKKSDLGDYFCGFILASFPCSSS